MLKKPKTQPSQPPTSQTPAQLNRPVQFSANLGRSAPQTNQSAPQSSQYGYFFTATQYANPNNIRIFDAQGNAQACPRCCTSKITQPGLTFKYSTCCGKVLCQPCQESGARQPPAPCDTPGCIGRIDRSSWTTLPIDMYRYELEVKQRDAMFRLRSLEPVDFFAKDGISWDDFQEELQLFIYDLTYSNIHPDQRSFKIKELERKYTQQIKRKDERLHNSNQSHQSNAISLQQLSQQQKPQLLAQQQQVQHQNRYLATITAQYNHIHHEARQLQIELYTEDEWERTFAPRFENNLDPTILQGIIELRQQSEEILNAQTSSSSKMDDIDATTPATTPNPTPQARQPDPQSQRIVAQAKETESKLKHLRHRWMVAERANASGYVDMSYVPITSQYINLARSLRQQEDDFL